MLDPPFIREVGDVDQTFNSLLDLYKRAKLGKSCNLAFNDFSTRVTILNGVPWIFQNLPQPQTEARCREVHFQHHSLETLALFEHFAGMLYALGPGHLRHVDQSFHARLKFDEGAEICQPCNDSRDAIPRIQPRRRFFPGALPHLARFFFQDRAAIHHYIFVVDIEFDDAATNFLSNQLFHFRGCASAASRGREEGARSHVHSEAALHSGRNPARDDFLVLKSTRQRIPILWAPAGDAGKRHHALVVAAGDCHVKGITALDS